MCRGQRGSRAFRRCNLASRRSLPRRSWPGAASTGRRRPWRTLVESLYLTLTGTAPAATTVSNDVFQMEIGNLTPQQLVTQLYFSGQFIDQEVNEHV